MTYPKLLIWRLLIKAFTRKDAKILLWCYCMKRYLISPHRKGIF